MQPVAALQLGYRLGVAADNGQRFVAIDDGIEQALGHFGAHRVPGFKILGRERFVDEGRIEVQRGRGREENIETGACDERLHGGVHAAEGLFIADAAVMHAVHSCC